MTIFSKKKKPRANRKVMADWIAKFKKYSRNKKIIIILLLSFPSMLVMFALVAQVTSRPTFCTSCHYMEPFYDSWKMSSHNEVACTKCHFPPGIAGTIRGKIEGLVQVVNYLTSSYVRRKPWAEISDESCTQEGCHDHRLLEGRVNFKNVVFDHKHHIAEMRRGKKLRCTSCHSQIVQGDHMVVTETACFLCHFKKGDHIEKELYQKLSNCQTCHHWESFPKEEMSQFRYDHTDIIKNEINCTKCHQNTIIGDGFVPRENCYSCHFDNERLSKFDDTELLHNQHIYENKIECIQCHLRIQHKVQKLVHDEELSCITCHTSEHNEQLMLFTGEPHAGVKGVPNTMYEAGLTCSSCHLYHKDLIGEAAVTIANPQSCESCHGKGYAHLLHLWQESSDRKIKELKKVLAGVISKLKTKGVYSNNEVQSYIEKAQNSIYFVDVGGAIHNIKYSDEIISESYNFLKKALENGKVKYRLPKLISLSSFPGECINCHTGIEEISRQFGRSEFSHKIHILNNNINCSKCHSNERKHGELIIEQQDCNSCHHKKASDKNCVKCHTHSFEIYTGTFHESESPSFMSEGDVSCSDCHLKDSRIIRPKDKQCEDCHEEGYIDIAKEWRADILRAVSDVEREITKLKSSADFIYTFKFAKLEKNFSNVVKGSANGIHNYELTLELLEELKKDLIKSQTIN